MIKIIALSILTLTGAGAFACEPYGLQGVTVGAVSNKAKIVYPCCLT
jgi:hypothetical protein